jgi:hypothetical protein
MTSAPRSSDAPAATPSLVVAPPAHPWLDASVDDLTRLTTEAGPALRRRLERALRTLARMNGGDSIASVLRRPSSTPFVPLVDAVAADLGLTGDPRVALLGRSTVLLYVYVRVQDDLVDEPRRVDRASVFAAEALLSEHLALFGAAVPDARASTLRSGIMRRFADVAAAEVDDRARAVVPDGPLDWMGDKFLPMAVPLVGLAVAAGRPELAERLVAFVRALGTGLQLVNDILNVREDHEGGRSTPLLRWLAADGVIDEAASIGAVLLGHPAMERALAEARRTIAEAHDLAVVAGLPATAAIATRGQAMVDSAPLRLLAAMLETAV